MIKNIVETEFLKLKGTKATWVLVFCTLVTCVLNFFAFKNNLIWAEYYKLLKVIINVIVGISIFYIITAYIFSQEYTQKTINTMFTYPISKMKFFIAKMLVIFIIIFASIMTTLIISTLIGFFAKHDLLTYSMLIKQFKDALFMVLMHFALTPIAAFIAIKSRSFLPVILFMICIVFINFISVNTFFMRIFPWSIPSYISYYELDSVKINYLPLALILIATFIISIILSLRAYGILSSKSLQGRKNL